MTTQSPRIPLVPAGIVLRAGAVAILMVTLANPVASAEPVAQQQIVDKAQLTLEAFASDGQLKDQFRDDVKALHDSLSNAKVDSEAASDAKSNGKGRRPRD